MSGPIYNTARSGDPYFPIDDWDSGVGAGMYRGYGISSLDYVAVYGPDSAALSLGVPVTSVDDVPSTEVPLVYRQAGGTTFQKDVTVEFTPQADDPNISGPDTILQWAHHNPVSYELLNEGYTFRWNVPLGYPSGTYRFAVRSISKAGMMDNKKFSIFVPPTYYEDKHPRMVPSE